MAPPNTFFPRKTNIGIPLTSEFLGGESDTIREIPPEFRAALDLTVIEIPMPWDVLPVPLSDTVLASKAEQKVTAERMRRTTYKPPGQKSLVEHYTDKYKQFGLRTRTFKTQGDSTLTPTVTRDVNTKNLGNLHFIEDDEDSLTLFTEELFKVSIPDPLPKQFAILLPTSEHSYVTPEVVSPPVLAANELSHESQQVNVFVGRETSISRDLISLPRSLVEYRVTPEQQLMTITNTLDSGLQSLSITPTTLLGEIENLGNGMSLKRLGIVPNVFDKTLYSATLPNVIPLEMRAIIPTLETASTSAGNATAITLPLPSGYLKIVDEDVTDLTHRVSTERFDLGSLPAILTSYKMSPEQQVITELSTLATGLQTISPTSTTVSAEVINLGNGLSLEKVGNVPSVFARTEGETSVPDLIPQEFRGILPLRLLATTFPGTASNTPVLGTAELSRKEEQLTVFNMRRTVTSRDPSSFPAQLTSYKLTRDKQVETVIGTLNVGLQTIPPVSALTIEADVKNLGNNLSLLTVGTVTSLFTALEASTEVADLVPELFKAVLPTHTEAQNIAGTVVDPPILSLGDFYRTERQLDVFTKRVTTRGRAGLILPVSRVASRQLTEVHGGEQVKTTAFLDSSEPPVEFGLGVLASNVKDLGNGLFLRETTKWDTATAWPILHSRLWDDNMRVEYDQTEQVVAAGTAEDPDPGTFAWVSEVKAIDKWRSKKINVNKPSPIYVDSSSALIEYEMKPFRFPGYIQNSGTGYYVRAAEALVVQHKIRTWWVKSSTPPVVPFDPIITGDVIINNLSNTGLEYARQVLHDGFTIGTIGYPATTPSASQYALGASTGSAVTNLITLFNNGSGYAVGNTLSISGGGHSTSVTITAVGVSNSVLNYTPLSGSFGWPVGFNGPYAATGGSGTGAQFVIQGVSVPTYDGSKWIGTPRTIAATVKHEKEKDVWKVVTEEVVMQ